MSFSFEKKMVIGVSSRALFDLSIENEIFEREGVEAYCRYQVEHEQDILKPGPGFSLIQSLLSLNQERQGKELVEVIVMSRNSPDTSLRVFNAIQYYKLPITRAVLVSGASLAPYLKAFHTDLFLSAYEDDVQCAIDSGIAAGIICTDNNYDVTTASCDGGGIKNRTTEGRIMGGKTAEGKTAEGKIAEGKTVEGKTIGDRTTEGKNAGSKVTEARTIGNESTEGKNNVMRFPSAMKQIRIAFDGDAVLFTDESEKIFKAQGLEAFERNESSHACEPLEEGPFANFLRKLSELQKLLGTQSSPIRTALVTSRSAPAHERVIRTLRAWNVRVDEAFFLGGIEKQEVLAAFGAQIFFDDQSIHTQSAAKEVPSARVPYRREQNIG